MRKLILLFTFFLPSLSLYAQNIYGFISEDYRGYEWNEPKERFMMIESETVSSYFYFVDETLYFKKGDNGWLQNELEYQEQESKESELACFIDNFGQFITVEENKITFFYEYDGKNYQKKIDYFISKRNDQLVKKKFENRRSSSNTSSDNDLKQFKRIYSQLSVYKDGNWEDWSNGNNTLVFNYNKTTNILLYKDNGEKELLQNMGGKEEGETTGGKKYQIINVLDEAGTEFKLQLFNNGDAKFIYNVNYMIQLH